MKIAIFDNSFNGCGARRALFDLVCGLEEHGHVIDLYVLSTYVEKLFPTSQHVKNIYTIPIRPVQYAHTRCYLVELLINLCKSLAYIPRFKRASAQAAEKINAGQYDVAFINTASILPFLHIPSVFYCHQPVRQLHEPLDVLHDDGRQRSGNIFKNAYTVICRYVEYIRCVIEHGYRERNMRHATIAVTNSRYVREYTYCTINRLIDVSYLGVDTQVYCPINASRTNSVLSVGGIEASKRFHDIVDALSLIREEKRPELIIATSRIVENTCERLKKRAHEKNVSLTIKQDMVPEELARLYNEVRAVVFVPLMEPFGLVSLEAMACGTPVIGINEGGVREAIMHNCTGLLVDRDIHAIAEAIESLQDSDELWQKISAQGLQRIEEFWTRDKATQRIEHYLEKAINRYRNNTGTLA